MLVDVLEEKMEREYCVGAVSLLRYINYNQPLNTQHSAVDASAAAAAAAADNDDDADVIGDDGRLCVS